MFTGNAVLTIWHDIDAPAQRGYLEWHVHEHMPERISIPGFVRGRRGVAVDPHGSPKYVTLYEAESVDVFRSVPYLERLDHPTPWTVSLQPSFQNFVRYANEIDVQQGIGSGAFVTTARFETRSSADYEGSRERLASLVADIGALPCVSSAALAKSRDDITDYVTEEAELRPENAGHAGIAHVALITVDTVTADAAAAVRDLIRETARDLAPLEVGECATYLVDYSLDGAEVERGDSASRSAPAE